MGCEMRHRARLQINLRIASRLALFYEPRLRSSFKKHRLADLMSLST